MVNIVRNNGGKVIVNEVTTGVGRTGKWFGFQHYDIDPDLVAIGKGIGNGCPVSVAAINKAMAGELEKNRSSMSNLIKMIRWGLQSLWKLYARAKTIG